MPKTLHIRFALLQTVFFVVFAVSVAYLVPMLSSLGYQTLHVTVIMTASAAASALLQPVLGHLCDTRGHERLIVLTATFLPAGFLFLLWQWGHIFAVALAATALTYSSVQSMTGVIDSWASKLKGEGHLLNFSATRSFGSVAYALTSLLFGMALDFFGIRVAPLAVLLCFPLMLAVLLMIPEPSRKGAAGAIREAFAKTCRSLLGLRPYRLFLVCYFLVMLPFASYTTFFPLWFEQLGGTQSQLGGAFFVMAVAEMIAMMLYVRFRRRLRAESLLLIAFLVFGAKNIVTALATGVAPAIALNLMQFGCYGILVPGVVDYLSSLIPARQLSTGQLAANAVGLSLSQIAGNFVFGLVADALGLKAMFLISSLPAFAGAALWLFGNIRIGSAAGESREVAE